MKLFMEYVEGSSKNALVSFCWRQKSIGTVINIRIPLFHHLFNVCLRCRPSSYKWGDRLMVAFRHSTVFKEINDRLWMQDKLPINWNLLSSGDARTKEQRLDNPLENING